MQHRGAGAGHLHLIIVLNSGLVLILVARDSVDGLVVQRVDLALNWAQRARDLAPCTRDRLQRQEALYTPCRLYVDGWLWGERQESEAVGGLCQGRPAVYRALIHMLKEVPRQGRLEGCNRMSAATHLICGLECV